MLLLSLLYAKIIIDNKIRHIKERIPKMFDYTKAAFNKMVDDIKRVAFIAVIIVQALAIIFPLYSIIAKTGNLIVNIVLLVVSVAYLVFYIVTHNKDSKKDKDTKKKVKVIYKIIKFSAKTVSLGIAIYALFISTREADLISLIIVALMIIGWILQVALELAYIFVKKRVSLLIDGIKADTQGALKVYNFYKRIKGEDEEQLEYMSEESKEFLDEQLKNYKKESPPKVKKRTMIKNFFNMIINRTEDEDENEDTAKANK